VQLVGFIIRIYHDAWSHEHHISTVLVQHTTFVGDYAVAYVISSMCVSHMNVWHNRNLQMWHHIVGKTFWRGPSCYSPNILRRIVLCTSS